MDSAAATRTRSAVKEKWHFNRASHRRGAWGDANGRTETFDVERISSWK